MTRTIGFIKLKSMNNLLPAGNQSLAAQSLKLFDGGRGVESKSGNAFETLDPGEDKVLGKVSPGAVADSLRKL